MRHFGVTGRNALLTHIANVDERRYRIANPGRGFVRGCLALGLLIFAILYITGVFQ